MRRDEHARHRKGGQNPVREGALAAVEQGAGEIIEGALAVSTTIAFVPGAVVIIAPGTDILTLAPETLEWPIFPA
jgi:hypothetical protein